MSFAEHTVESDVLCRVHDVDVAVYGLGALPLEDVKARRCREEHGSIEHVELGKCLIAFANVLASDVFVVLLEDRIVFGTCEVYGFLVLLLEFVQNWLENAPVSFCLSEYRKRDLLAADLGALVASYGKLHLQKKCAH